MSHRTDYRVLHVRENCTNNCFIKYRQRKVLVEGDIQDDCGGCQRDGCNQGCGMLDPNNQDIDHLVRNQEIIKLDKLGSIISETNKKTWLYVLDFFAPENEDVFNSLPNQSNTPLTVEGCVATMYANYIDKIEELHQKGIREVWLGVETAIPELRDSYNKPRFTNKELHDLCHKMRDAGIKFSFYLVHGPEDNLDSFRITNEMIRELRPELAWYSKLQAA